MLGMCPCRPQRTDENHTESNTAIDLHSRYKSKRAAAAPCSTSSVKTFHKTRRIIGHCVFQHIPEVDEYMLRGCME